MSSSQAAAAPAATAGTGGGSGQPHALPAALGSAPDLHALLVGSPFKPLNRDLLWPASPPAQPMLAGNGVFDRMAWPDLANTLASNGGAAGDASNLPDTFALSLGGAGGNMGGGGGSATDGLAACEVRLMETPLKHQMLSDFFTSPSPNFRHAFRPLMSAGAAGGGSGGGGEAGGGMGADFQSLLAGGGGGGTRPNAGGSTGSDGLGLGTSHMPHGLRTAPVSTVSPG